MGATFHRVGRWNYAAAAVLLLAVMVLPFFRGHALAYGQVTTRSIEMSSSAQSAAASYLVTFTPANTGSIAGVVVDFCSTDPLVGDACTKPTGFSVGAPTVTGFTVTGQTGGGTWTPTAANSNRTLELADSTAQSGTPTNVTFTLTTATNPSTLGTFYARIFTFATSAAPAAWVTADSTGASTTGVVDAGGIALSTVSNIQITAKVQEQLTFCTSGLVTGANPLLTGNCSTASPASLLLGHNNGSGTIVLDNTAVDGIEAFTQLSTNAGSGVIVRMKSNNTCSNGGLSSNGGGTCAIEGAGTTPGGATPAVVVAATPSGNPGGAFGMCVHAASANTIPETAYADAINSCPITGTDPWNATSKYGMDATTSNNNVTSTYGGAIFHTTAAVSAENDTLVFVGTATNTTPAGVYTVNENLIATGTF